MNASEPTIESLESKFGRCLLRLQECELLLKSLVANTEIAATAEQLQNPQEATINSVHRKTMGTLVGMFTEDTLVQAGDIELHAKDPENSAPSVRLNYRIELDAEQHDTLCSKFKELVALRNNLVHHFLQHFDIRKTEGRIAANNYLDECGKIIDNNSVTLRNFAKAMEHARRQLCSFVETQEFEDAMLRGDLRD